MSRFSRKIARFLEATKREGEVTKTYKITAKPEILKRVEAFIAHLQYVGNIGHSGLFAMGFDGDGSDKMTVEGIPDYKKLGVEVKQDQTNRNGPVEIVKVK